MEGMRLTLTYLQDKYEEEEQKNQEEVIGVTEKGEMLNLKRALSAVKGEKDEQRESIFPSKDENHITLIL